MKLALVCSAALLAAPAMADEWITGNGRDVVTLSDQPCSSQPVLQRLKPDFRSLMRDASAVVSGRSFHACWIVDGDGVHLVYEDGDQGLIPVSDFRHPEST